MSSVTPSNDFVKIQPEVQNSRGLEQIPLTDFELKSIGEQQRRLQYYTDQSNEESRQQQEGEVIINLSVVQILQKLSTTILNIINELLSIRKNAQLSDLVYIFIKEDRLIYVGILLMIIALGVYLIDITT